MKIEHGFKKGIKIDDVLDAVELYEIAHSCALSWGTQEEEDKNRAMELLRRMLATSCITDCSEEHAKACLANKGKGCVVKEASRWLDLIKKRPK